MVRSWIFQQNTSPPWKKIKNHLYVVKKTIDFPAVWMECAQVAQPSASGIFVCPSCRLFVSLSFVCTACILSVLICICLAGGFSLLGSELQLRHTFTWIKTEPSSHRACKFLYIVIFCLSTVKSRPVRCWKRRFYHSKPHPNTKGAQVLHLQHQWHSAFEQRFFFWG